MSLSSIVFVVIMAVFLYMMIAGCYIAELAERRFKQTLRRTERQLDRARTIVAAAPPPTVEQEVEKLRAQLFPN